MTEVPSPFYVIDMLSQVVETRFDWNKLHTKKVFVKKYTKKFTKEYLCFDIRLAQISSFYDFKVDVEIDGEIKSVDFTKIELTSGLQFVTPQSIKEFINNELPRYSESNEFYNTIKRGNKAK